MPFDPLQHPRGPDGRFITVAALRARYESLRGMLDRGDALTDGQSAQLRVDAASLRAIAERMPKKGDGKPVGEPKPGAEPKPATPKPAEAPKPPAKAGPAAASERAASATSVASAASAAAHAANTAEQHQAAAKIHGVAKGAHEEAAAAHRAAAKSARAGKTPEGRKRAKEHEATAVEHDTQAGSHRAAEARHDRGADLVGKPKIESTPLIGTPEEQAESVYRNVMATAKWIDQTKTGKAVAAAEADYRAANQAMDAFQANPPKTGYEKQYKKLKEAQKAAALKFNAAEDHHRALVTAGRDMMWKALAAPIPARPSWGHTDPKLAAIPALAEGRQRISDLVGAGHDLEKIAGRFRTVTTERSRAFFSSGSYRGLQDPAVNLHPTAVNPGAVAHEISHGIEVNDPEVYRACAAFRDRRTAGNPLVKMSELDPQNGYSFSDHEMARDDKFRDKYIGKVYDGQNCTEVLTMGVTYLVENPAGFARDDPEHFKLTVALLRKRNR
jgi:hypothetical protein